MRLDWWDALGLLGFTLACVPVHGIFGWHGVAGAVGIVLLGLYGLREFGLAGKG